MSTDLHIPEEAIDAVREIADEHDDILRAQAWGIAAPVVAAELRRLAEKVEKVSAFRLRARADELDPPRS